MQSFKFLWVLPFKYILNVNTFYHPYSQHPTIISLPSSVVERKKEGKNGSKNWQK
jgi:hypothetical protein